MNRVMTMLAALAAFFCGAHAAAAPGAAAEALIAADRGFSAAAADADLAEALPRMFADDVVMPNGPKGFARGRAEAAAALAANPANAGARARWAPLRAGISADGRHGFTFGYMTIEQPDKPARHAKYLSYWVKDADGWRVAAYKRAPSPAAAGTPPMPPLLPARLVDAPADPARISAWGASLAAAEQGFSDEAQKIGLGPAFEKHGRPDAINLGQEAGFLVGSRAIGAIMPPDPRSPLAWSAEDVLVAGSGDLGLTWGYIRPNAAPPAGQPAQIPFFTIWYRTDPSQPWRYVAE